MNPGAILIGAALLLISLVYMYEPFRRATASDPAAAPGAAIHREEKRQAALQQLLALDFDYELGQIQEEDYTSLRESLLAEVGKTMPAAQTWSDERLEALIQSRRNALAAAPAKSCHACGQPLQPEDRFCRSCGASQGTPCPGCGAPGDPADTYCPQCGYQQLEPSL